MEVLVRVPAAIMSVGSKIFKSIRKLCKETKLKEFQFKFIHRIVVTKRELFKYGIKTDEECCFCGEKDSIRLNN